MKNYDSVGFWKEVKQSNQSLVLISSKFSDYIGEKSIASMWKKHNFELLNSANDLSIKRDAENTFLNANFEHIQIRNCV